MRIVRMICFMGMLAVGACSENQAEPPLLPNKMYSADATTVRAVQSALRQRRYYSGVTDGFFGPATGVAIERFQMEHGLRVKAVIDRPLLGALGLANGSRDYR